MTHTSCTQLPVLSNVATMTRPDLLNLWHEVQGLPAPKNLSMPLLRKALSYEVQCRTLTGPSKALQRALKDAVTKSASAPSQSLPAGAQLVREWSGQTYRVEVTASGARMDGVDYASLSAVARHITGAHWSGPRFFGLRKRAGPKGG